MGYRKYFKNTGYAETCRYDGFEDHKYKYDSENRVIEHIIAIDALHFKSKKNSFERFDEKIIDR